MIPAIKVSIVTINYNAKKDLLRTFDSIVRQTYSNFELVIIDGGSTDGISDHFAEFRSAFEQRGLKLTLVSEKDAGIYDAMNKGLGYVSGDFCIMLNSGDLFFDSNSLASAIAAISNPDTIYYGRAKVELEDGFYFKPELDPLDVSYIKNYPVHQSVLIPKKFFHLRYDTRYTICADTVYLAELFTVSPPVYIAVDFVRFQLGGVSSHPKNFRQFSRLLEESVKVVSRYDKHAVVSLPRIVLALTTKYFLLNILPLKSFKRIFFNIKSGKGKA